MLIKKTFLIVLIFSLFPLTIFSQLINEDECKEKREIFEPFRGDDSQFTIQVWSSRADNIFYEGDEMFLNLYSDTNCYFYMYHVDVNGIRRRIYPNQYDKNNFLRAGTIRKIPEQSVFIVKPPYGEEYIFVFASNTPFENIPGEEKPVKITRSPDMRGMEVIYPGSAGKDTLPLEAEARYNYTIFPRQEEK